MSAAVRGGTRASIAVLSAALFTVSWARFATIPIGSFNLRLAPILFVLAIVLLAVDPLLVRREQRPNSRAWLLIIAIVGVMLLACVGAKEVVPALLQVAATVIGAVVPCAAVYLAVRRGAGTVALLNAFIRGGYFACGFGLYQLLAFYRGWPQFVEYQATSGGLGRISSFSYEPAYFGYFLVLVLGALVTRARLQGVRIPAIPVTFVLAVLLLANSRATLLTLPVLAVLVFWRNPSSVERARLVVGGVAACWLAAVVFLAEPRSWQFVVDRVSNLFNPAEQSSNAPRLDLYETCLRIVQEHFLTGIGPGQLVDYAPVYGLPNLPGATSNSVIANNVWLQAALDGGVALVLAQLLLVVAVVRVYARDSSALRGLAAGWLSVLVVASFVTSFFFDPGMWAVLGLLLAMARHGSTEAVGRTYSPALVGAGDD